MWTEPEHFANWYGPMGGTIPTAVMDVRVGGRRHITMAMDKPRGPMQMFFVGAYREVNPKTRLVYAESMADADRNPMTAEQMGMPADTAAARAHLRPRHYRCGTSYATPSTPPDGPPSRLEGPDPRPRHHVVTDAGLDPTGRQRGPGNRGGPRPVPKLA
jgi:uncharacterized protein YndB with AHSA1/START domain